MKPLSEKKGMPLIVLLCYIAYYGVAAYFYFGWNLVLCDDDDDDVVYVANPSDTKQLFSHQGQWTKIIWSLRFKV